MKEYHNYLKQHYPLLKLTCFSCPFISCPLKKVFMSPINFNYHLNNNSVPGQGTLSY